MRFTVRVPRSFSKLPAFPVLSLVTVAAMVLLTLGVVPAAAEDLRVTWHDGEVPIGELQATTAAGPLALEARHREYLDYLSRTYREADQANPMVRKSAIESRATADLEGSARLPFGLGVGMEEWEAGSRNFRVTGRSGVHLAGIDLDNRLTLVQHRAATGARTHSGNGQMALSFDFLGGQQRGAVNYDVSPMTQVSAFHLGSNWRFAEGGALRLGFGHRPLGGISNASFGLRQPVGPLTVTSNLAGNSLGAFSMAVNFTLNVGARQATPAFWSLSSLRAASLTPGTVVN